MTLHKFRILYHAVILDLLSRDILAGIMTASLLALWGGITLATFDLEVWYYWTTAILFLLTSAVICARIPDHSIRYERLSFTKGKYEFINSMINSNSSFFKSVKAWIHARYAEAMEVAKFEEKESGQ